MFGRRTHAQRRRRRYAVTACLLWLLAVEVLPSLHLAFHADDHTHGADGAIVHADSHAEHHHHGAAPAEHHHHDHAPAVHAAEDHPERDRDRGRGEPALDPAPSTHAAAGVAHHAIALHRPPPPLLEPLPVPRAGWPVESAPESQHHDALRTRPNARGPPATA